MEEKIKAPMSPEEMGKQCAQAAKQTVEQILDAHDFDNMQKVTFWTEFYRELNNVE